MDTESPENTSDAIRYQGKAVEDSAWIVEFLNERTAGVLGLVDGEEPHLVTQLFVYDEEENAIFLHGARAGRAHGIVEREGRPPVCFTTSEMGRFVPADEPVNFTVEYESVVAYGPLSLVSGREEKHRVLERFMAKFAPHLSVGEDYAEMTDESLDRTAVYRLDVESWSGKRGLKAPDYPGAYHLDDVQSSG